MCTRILVSWERVHVHSNSQIAFPTLYAKRRSKPIPQFVLGRIALAADRGFGLNLERSIRRSVAPFLLLPVDFVPPPSRLSFERLSRLWAGWQDEVVVTPFPQKSRIRAAGVVRVCQAPIVSCCFDLPSQHPRRSASRSSLHRSLILAYRQARQPRRPLSVAEPLSSR